MKTVNDLFPDWHSIVQPGASGDVVTARHSVVKQSARKQSKAMWLDVARVYLGIPPVGTDFVESFVKDFREADATMPASSNDELLKVLSGSMLSAGFEKGNAAVDAAALAVISANYCGKGAVGQPIPEIILRASHYLDVRSRELRDLSTPRVTARKMVTRGPNSKDSLTSELKVPSFDQIVNHQHYDIANTNFKKIRPTLVHLIQAVEALEKHLSHVVSTANTAIADARSAGDNRVPTLQEETDLLWWVLGGYSYEADAPFDEVAPAQRALYAAWELASRTRHVPGHAGARGFLCRVLGNEESRLHMFESIESVTRERRKHWTEGIAPSHAQGVLPLTHAMLASLQVAEGAEWRPVVDAAPGPDSADDLSMLQLAEQFYKESLLARLFRESD